MQRRPLGRVLQNQRLCRLPQYQPLVAAQQKLLLENGIFLAIKYQVSIILEKSSARPSSAPPSSKTLALPRRMRRTGTRPGTPPGRGAWMTGAPLSMPSSPDRSSERRSSSACMPGGRWTRPSGLRSPVSSPRGARSRRSLRRLSKALQPWLPRSRVGTPS